MPTEIERWEPFREMMSLRNRLDHLIDSAFGRPRGEFFAAVFDYPALDLYETDNTIKVDIPLPGVKPDDVELTVSGNVLTIKGERKSKEEIKEDNYYRHEMRYGSFSRSVALPEAADVAKPEASFDHGVLTVSFPKQASTEPKRIAITAREPRSKTVG